MSALLQNSETELNFDLLRAALEVKSKYGLRCSTEEEPSEAEMSIAYQRLKNSFEDDSKSESSIKTQQMKDIILVKEKYNIFDDDMSEISASIAYQELSGDSQRYPQISSKPAKVNINNHPSSALHQNSRKFGVCVEYDSHNRKIIYARSLKDLIRKGKSEFLNETQFNQELRVLLFDDDTEVDDEEYFQTLPDETLFVFTKNHKAKFRSRSCETKFPLQRCDTSQDGLTELAALLLMDGRVEGRGERIGTQSKARTVRTQSSNFEEEVGPSFSLVEEIRRKLETHSNSLRSPGRGLRRGGSFEISPHSSSFDNANLPSSSPLNERSCNSDQRQFISLENNFKKLEDFKKSLKPRKQQHMVASEHGLLKLKDLKQSKDDLSATAKNFNPSLEEKGNKEIDKLSKNDTSTTTKTRKKVLKRSSKIEIETSTEKNDNNFNIEFKTEGQHHNIKCQKDEKSNNSLISNKTKPILKRSDHFEISVDKNSVLRNSESMRKVLHKDLNIRGKLLNLPAYNDISFDSSFKPVHR